MAGGLWILHHEHCVCTMYAQMGCQGAYLPVVLNRGQA